MYCSRPAPSISLVLLCVLQGADLKTLLLEEGQGLKRGFLGQGLDLPAIMDKGWDDVNVVHGVFGSACYIDDSYPSMLYLAYKYAGEQCFT
jgi:hypothetical protein